MSKDYEHSIVASPSKSERKNRALAIQSAPSKPHSVLFGGRPLHEIVADQIRDMIVEREVAPGDFLDEMALAEKLNVSRTPIREAVRVLAQDHFVTTYQNRGSYATVVTPQYVRDIVEVLVQLEALGAKLACERVHDRTLREIRQLHEEMKIAYRAEDRPLYFRLNQEIHSAIVRASNNEQLIETHSSYTNRARRFRYVDTITPKLWSRSMADHEAIIKAFEARNADQLQALMRDHMDGIPSVIVEEIGRQSADQAPKNMPNVIAKMTRRR